MSKDVFISYASQDAATAMAVCTGLESRRLRCWIAPRDIQPGQPWGASIVRALDDCPVMVLVLTARSNASRHVVREVERADGKRARIVTFRVEAVVMDPSLEYFLSADHWFDAVDGRLQHHLPALADTVQTLRGLARPAQAAAPQADARRPPALGERELVSAFDDLAPDHWNRAPGSKLGRFFQGLFADR